MKDIFQVERRIVSVLSSSVDIFLGYMTLGDWQLLLQTVLDIEGDTEEQLYNNGENCSSKLQNMAHFRSVYVRTWQITTSSDVSIYTEGKKILSALKILVNE